jgi:hypothetical protein
MGSLSCYEAFSFLCEFPNAFISLGSEAFSIIIIIVPFNVLSESETM